MTEFFGPICVVIAVFFFVLAVVFAFGERK
jgi:hypothetical protein